MGRTRHRERHGSTGRAGRSKAEDRLAGRFFIDDLLCCGSLGHEWPQPHRSGNVKNSVVKRTGHVNQAVWADASRLQVPAEACGWDRGRSASVSVFGRYSVSSGRERELTNGRTDKAPAPAGAFVSCLPRHARGPVSGVGGSDTDAWGSQVLEACQPSLAPVACGGVRSGPAAPPGAVLPGT